jgi:predicted DsbA family dithiol-disulfide isomerase
MRIEIWSDVVCPWCYIGKRRFEQALAERPDRDEIEVVYRSFELDPRAPEHGTESVVEAIGRKYGGGPVAGRGMVDRVTGTAAETGLTFDFAGAPHSRTLDAHRLLHLALAEGGPALQAELKEAFLAAYFTHARSMGEHNVLRQVTRSVGLDAALVDEVLASEAYADEVQHDLTEARELGIGGVPFYVLDRRLAVSGAQPVEVFAEALERAWRESRPRLRMVAAVPAVTSATACGPDRGDVDPV